MAHLSHNERRILRLQVSNRIILPLLSAARRFSRIWRAYNPLLSGVSRLEQSRDYTLTILVVHLPASNPLVVALYTSTQESRPITPSQLERRLKRLQHQLARLRGKIFNSADILYAVIAPKGFTSGAHKLARRLGVNLASKPEDILNNIARYIKTRLNKLYIRIKGKRIWGELPLLLYALQELALRLGAKNNIITPEEALQLAEKGGTIS